VAEDEARRKQATSQITSARINNRYVIYRMKFNLLLFLKFIQVTRAILRLSRVGDRSFRVLFDYPKGLVIHSVYIPLINVSQYKMAYEFKSIFKSSTNSLLTILITIA
jgi:hypothetical protein